MKGINYPGGKGLLYQKYINLMPPHETYIETHLGAGSILRNKREANRTIGIDIDSSVIEMWESNCNEIDFDLIMGDAVAYLKNYTFKGNELVYCDPPYLRETRKKHYPLYKYEYTLEQHIDLLKVIKSLPCMVMISGYYSELYSDLLNDWHSHSFQATTHNGMATEWIWMNYSQPLYLHDYQYLGDNYRERERIKKKKHRWVERLKRISVLERQALLSAIESVKKEQKW